MQTTQNGSSNGVRQLLGPDGLPMPRPEDSFALPHAATFSSITNYASRTYSFRWDEAVKFNIKDALSMRRDAFLMGLLRERQLATAQLNWHLEPDDENDPIQQATCEGMTKIIKGIPHLQKLLMTLLEAVWYGRYGAQVVWGYKDIAGDKRMTVVKHQPVNGDKILYRFRLTNDGPDIQDGTPAILVHAAEVSKLPQVDTVVTDKARALLLRSEFWRERFIIHHHETEDADYGDNQAAGGLYGIGIRSRIFWLDWLRKEYLSWVSDYLERVGLGITVWYFEAGNPESEKAAFESAKSQSQNFNIVWPRPIGGEKQGAGIERLETSTNGADILLRMQEHIEGIIERYIVGQTLSANAESTGLGSGVADFQAQTKHKIIKFDAQNLEETLTTDLLGPLKKWNFQGITHGVRWVFDIDVPNAKEQLDAAKTIVDMGIDLDADEVRGIGGFSKPEEGAEVTKQQQPANPFGGGDFGKPGAEDQQNDKQQEEEGNPFSQFGRRGQAVHFEKGRWITIGGSVGAEGKRHGGSPVYIENGKITKGHPGLTGKKIDALKEPSESTDSNRQQIHQSKGYNRAVAAKAARKEGVDPKALHQLAAEIIEHDKAFKGEHTQVLQRARELSKKLGYGSLQGIKRGAASGEKDADSIKGLDDTAERLQEEFPEYFAGDESPQERLYNLLVDGNPEAMTEDEAYGQAMEHLREVKNTPKEEEKVPFSKPDESIRIEKLERDMQLLHDMLEAEPEEDTEEDPSELDAIDLTDPIVQAKTVAYLRSLGVSESGIEKHLSGLTKE